MERYKAIFDCFPDIVILTDVLGTIIDINRAPQGYRKEDVIGTDFKDFHNNDQMILFEKAVEETIQSNRPSSYEVLITNPKGTVLHWKNNISVLKTKGIPTMLIINCRVLKEQKKVEGQFGISDEIYNNLINNESTIDLSVDMHTKLDELSRTNNDMKNLLDSTEIATLFLDNSLSVRRFTSETSKITKLIPSDMGRPITDIASALLYPELADDVHQVLRTLVKIERQISTPHGDWFKTRILPYRTLENMIDGVVITFTDITASKKLEAELRATEARLRKMIDRK